MTIDDGFRDSDLWVSDVFDSAQVHDDVITFAGAKQCAENRCNVIYSPAFTGL
ncbi:MAG: hypothetical protein K2Q25_15645 [Mycobacteriaceae bacterium]|nr:hypothetical protein [Mycobacteriaceae bacterium]